MGKIFSFLWLFGLAICLFYVHCPLIRILKTKVFENFDDGLFFVMLLFLGNNHFFGIEFMIPKQDSCLHRTQMVVVVRFWAMLRPLHALYEITAGESCEWRPDYSMLRWKWANY